MQIILEIPHNNEFGQSEAFRVSWKVSEIICSETFESASLDFTSCKVLFIGIGFFRLDADDITNLILVIHNDKAELLKNKTKNSLSNRMSHFIKPCKQFSAQFISCKLHISLRNVAEFSSLWERQAKYSFFHGINYKQEMFELDYKQFCETTFEHTSFFEIMLYHCLLTRQYEVRRSTTGRLARTISSTSIERRSIVRSFPGVLLLNSRELDYLTTWDLSPSDLYLMASEQGQREFDVYN